MTIAALYVDPKGCYANLDGVECWGLPERDARLYAGPWPVVAHPPCQRWGRYWGGSPTTWPRLKKGDDGGCFAAALASVRTWGGALEHPEGSHAWRAFGLATPPRWGGWIKADWITGHHGWTCCVEQGAYGHRARKATWLYCNGIEYPPPLDWGWADGEFIRLDDGYGSAEQRATATDTKIRRIYGKEVAATPLPFRDLLLSLARSAAPARLPLED